MRRSLERAFLIHFGFLSLCWIFLAPAEKYSPSYSPSSSSTSTTTELHGAVKVKINVGEGEPIESALRRFKREVSKSGHLMELRHRRYFENSQERAKRKVKEARLRKKFERVQRRRTRQQLAA